MLGQVAINIKRTTTIIECYCFFFHVDEALNFVFQRDTILGRLTLVYVLCPDTHKHFSPIDHEIRGSNSKLKLQYLEKRNIPQFITHE